MFSLIKTVVSYIWNGSSDQVAEEDDMCPEELPNLISFLQSDDRNVKVHDKRTGINTVIGKVTFISSDYCLINDYYYLDLRKFNFSHILEVGTRIAFSVFRLGENDEWQISRVYSVGEEAWDEEDYNCGSKMLLKKDQGTVMCLEDAANKGLAQKRTVIGKVQQREGRTVVIDPGDVRFSLDEVETNIVPFHGDWLSLETLVQLDQESGDLGGEILKVVKVSALRVRLVEKGEVTRSETAFAVINNDILAFKLSYCPGYEPKVGDCVVLQAIESDCGNGCSWRAVALAPADASKQKVIASSENSGSEENECIEKDQKGIVIKGDCNFGNMTLGSEAERVLVVCNEGECLQTLLHRKFHIARSQSQMVLISTEYVGNEGNLVSAYEPIRLYPGMAVSFKFQCEPRFLGSSSELFMFTFRGFRIGRYLRVRVVDAISNSAQSICENPGRDLYQRKSDSSRWQRYRKPTNGIVVPGVMPYKAPAFTSVKLPMYEIPDRLWDAVVDSDNPVITKKSFHHMLDDLKKSVPAFDWDCDNHFGLNPINYKQYFHTLLHLEEIEMTLKMQERDLFGVTMHPTGPQGLFLALEVPGLVEARPSIMIGDRVIVTPHDNAHINSRTQFEGFVHRITKTEVWLRFGKVFHDLFEKIESGVVEKDGTILEIVEAQESLWNVSFHFSRTPLRRCHLAVDLALKHLGENFIFPKKITIKKPQIYLSERVERASRKSVFPKVPCDEKDASVDRLKVGSREIKITALNVKRDEHVMNGIEISTECTSDGSFPKKKEQSNINPLQNDCEYHQGDVINDVSSSSNSSLSSWNSSSQRIPVVQRLFGANSTPHKSFLSDQDDSNSFDNQKTDVVNGLEYLNGKLNGKDVPPAATLSGDRLDEREEFVPSHRKRTVKWFNQKLNKQQKGAVLNILKGEARPLPYVIFGPPGTGKTVTVVEAILQILHLVPESRILVATPSNSSADLIAERILDLVPLNPGELVRLIALHCLEDGKIPSCLMPYCTTGVAGRSEDTDEAFSKSLELGKKLKIPMSAASLGRHRITIGTCVALGQLHALGLPKGHFTHVFLDEAGQSTEPEALIPLGFLSTSADIGWGQAVLAGDPRQLGPVVISKLANHFGLGQAFLARILTTSPYAPDPIGYPDKSTGHHNSCVLTRLIVNYRSVPKLLSLTSDMFYDGTLIPTVSALHGPEGQLLLKMSKHLPPMKCLEELKGVKIASPLVFHGVRGEEARLTDSPSWYNPMEAVQCLEYMKVLYHLAELSPSDIGIITPYVEQVKTIRNLIGDSCLPLPKVGTVEEFQGQERLVILLSCVRTSQSQIAVDLMHALGFVSSSNRMNVATSRARALLIILGDPHLLQHDPLWNKVIVRCLENESYIGCDLPSTFSKHYQETEISKESLPDN